jgi:uncharacterized protein YbjT (DUF2867 family)
MIVVTGATGNVGRHVVDELALQGQTVRALTRHAVPQEIRPNVTWVIADFEDDASLAVALKGAERVVLISPAHPRMQEHQEAVVNAAAQAGVRKLAKLSGLGAAPDAPIRLPKMHYAIEQCVVNSALTYSFVRPNLFMQVLLGSAQSVAGTQAIYAPAGTGKISFTDARDVARVLSKEVMSDANSICEITGPDALSYQDAARILGDTINKPVHHVDVTPAQARESMLVMGMDPWVVDAFLELFEIYRAGHGAAVLSEAVYACTGRAATPLTKFFAEHKDAFRQAA